MDAPQPELPAALATEDLRPPEQIGQLLLDAYVRLGSYELAAREVGITADFARRVLRSRSVTAILLAGFAQAGITAASVAKTISDAMAAETETPLTFRGTLAGVHRQPDHRTRLRAAALAIQVADRYEDRAIDIEAKIIAEQQAARRQSNERPLEALVEAVIDAGRRQGGEDALPGRQPGQEVTPAGLNDGDTAGGA